MKLDVRMKALIAVGASVTANCQPCLQYHATKARESGADEGEIDIAIAVAKAVRTGAAAKMDDFAAGLVTATAAAECCSDRDCGCAA